MGINTNIELEACYFVATPDMRWWSGNASSNPSGALEIPSVSDTWITRLNEKNITANATYANTSDYRTWELGDDGKPRLVRP